MKVGGVTVWRAGENPPKNYCLVKQFGKDAHERRNAVVPFWFPSPESPSLVCTVTSAKYRREGSAVMGGCGDDELGWRGEGMTG